MVLSRFGHLQHRAWKGVFGSARLSSTDAAWESLERNALGRGAARGKGAWEGQAWPGLFAGVYKARLGAALGLPELMGNDDGSSGEVTRRAYVTRGYAGRPY